MPHNAQAQKSLEIFSKQLTQLIPIIQDPKSFFHTNQDAPIKQQIHAVRQLAHSLKFDRPSTSANQIYRFVFPYLDQDLAMIEKLFQQGEKPLARHLLEKNIRMCLDCHTRRKESQHMIFQHQPASLSSWSNLQKARYFAATWNFAESIRYYEYALSNKQFSQNTAEWLHSLKQLISIVIRFQKNPSLAMEMSRVFIHHKTAPSQLVQVLNSWSQAAEEWRKETSFPRTRLAKIQKLEELYKKGMEKEKARPHTGTIEMLRAHNLALSILEEGMFDALYGQALYWAATLAESSRDTNLWTLDTSLYEACVRFQPHTDFAQKCLIKLEREYQEFAKLSQRKMLPQILQLRLQRLRELAQPKR